VRIHHHDPETVDRQELLTIPRRWETIEAHQAQGGKIAAVFPIHYPRALFRAFDLLPVEVWGPPAIDPGLGVTHIQPYICSVVRNGLAFLLAGGLDVADVIVVPHTCDSLQGLGSILLDFVRPRSLVLPLYLPRGRRESDLDFLTAELRAAYRQLETSTGRAPAPEGLLAAVHREEAADAHLAELHLARRHLGLSNSDFYRLIRSREYLPAEAFTRLAQQALSHPGPPDPRPAVPILLSGIIPEPPTLLDAIADLGGAVVGDDLASCGRRLYPPGRSDDPFRRMAERIIHAPPDPMRGSPIQDRARHLLDLADRTGARSVIFYEVKFCEPELFDLPLLQRELQGAGIPSVIIEADLNDSLSGQTLTRIGALLEMLA
jgi:benzoyl-CoA reductase/2-hydroxyglutaryl-CoA dehydratase subunit BcrC/BadD/HgdB